MEVRKAYELKKVRLIESSLYISKIIVKVNLLLKMILSYDLVKIYNLVSKIKLKLFGEVNIGLAALTSG